jgi:hypothetical protein
MAADTHEAITPEPQEMIEAVARAIAPFWDDGNKAQAAIAAAKPFIEKALLKEYLAWVVNTPNGCVISFARARGIDLEE